MEVKKVTGMPINTKQCRLAEMESKTQIYVYQLQLQNLNVKIFPKNKCKEKQSKESISMKGLLKNTER